MKNKLVEFLCQLNKAQASERSSKNTQDEIFTRICSSLEIDYELIAGNLSNITSLNFSEEGTKDWKCICLSFYIIKLLNLELEKSDVLLSVRQSKDVRNCLRNIVNMGICTRLQQNLPFSIKPNIEYESSDIFWNYNVLKCTTFGLCEFYKSPHLRLLFLPESLKEVLVAVLQISYCPLQKPQQNPGNQTNIMTEEIHRKVTKEKEMFVKILDSLEETIHPSIFVKDLMIVFQENSPTWFKRSISQRLTAIIRSGNGVEKIASALFGECENDSAQIWRTVDVFSRIILGCRGFPDFRDNICKQVVGLLDKTSEKSLIYERVFAHCAKALYKEDQESAKLNFVGGVVRFFVYFTYDHRFNDSADVTRKVQQCSRLLHALFVQNSVENSALHFKVLKPVMNVLFRFFVLTSNSPLTTTNNDLRAILMGYCRRYPEDSFILFDSFLFGINTSEILSFRHDISVHLEHETVTVRASEHSVTYSSSENSACLLELVRSDSDLAQKLFGFLLNCLSNRDKYFTKGSTELLELEDYMMSQFFERKMTVYRLLSELAEDKTVQKELSNNPHDVVKYIKLVLERTVELGTHKTADTDSEGFQSLFIILMILQSLLKGSNKSSIHTYSTLLPSLSEISEETANVETRDLINQIMEVLEGKKHYGTKHLDEEKTELDKAIEDVCDPLLPVRGHGLMALTKLVARKDRHAMERKNYVLNIFQQNLKNEDSFIYLSAIGGLAALADVFPDSVLHILCEEFSDSTRKSSEGGHEVRMKLGECLVRATKSLGEMAPKYKPLLLNTFLIGAKEDDDLIRASSLSNLGEICRVLGYKLGTIVTEVLVCVHAVIATDKSPQARRAAVSVIRQLFVGLDKEMIAFLKDDILTIYRTLKDVYNNDVDDVMRLQSQLALEELNENMKSFVFAAPELHDEKKILMLN